MSDTNNRRARRYSEVEWVMSPVSDRGRHNTQILIHPPVSPTGIASDETLSGTTMVEPRFWTITVRQPLLDHHCWITIVGQPLPTHPAERHWESELGTSCLRTITGNLWIPLLLPTLHIFLCENWYLPTFINAWLNRRSTVRYICVSRLSLESWSSVSTNKYLKNQETNQNQENIRLKI